MSAGLRLLVVPMLILSIAGCAFGPRSVKIDRRRYNESVETTNREEALLNIVRLRYEDTPGNLRISGITTQRSWINTAQVNGAIGPDALKLANLGGVSTWTERPTVTYSTGSREQSMAIYTPLSTETLFVLSLSGWSLQRLWTVSIENINGISNARGASGPIPDFAPEYGRFQTLIGSMQALVDSQGCDVSRKSQFTPISGPIPIASLAPSEIREAEQAGYVYKPTESGEAVVLNKAYPSTIIRFSEEAAQSPDGQAVIEILGLDPDEREFELKLALGGRLSTEIEPRGKRTHILVTPRSLLQIMFFLSKGVDVPQPHIEEGIARGTLGVDDCLFNWQPVIGHFSIKHSKHKPDNAVVSVPYRGYWFYIDDRDVNSKRTLVLLDQISESQVEIGGAEKLPTLTLPL